MKLRLAFAVLLCALLAAASPATAFTPYTERAETFTDVPPDHPTSEGFVPWKTYVIYAAHRGWFEGYEDGSFRPDEEITASQMTTVLKRVFPTGGTRADFASFIKRGLCGGGTEAYGAVPMVFPYVVISSFGGVVSADVVKGTWIAVLLDDGCEGFFPRPSAHGPGVDDYVSYSVERGWFTGYPDGSFRPDQSITARQMTKVLGRVFPEGSTRAEFAKFLTLADCSDDLHDIPLPVEAAMLLGKTVDVWWNVDPRACSAAEDEAAQ